MKILHTSDWHLGAYVGPQCDDPGERMAHTCQCLDKLVDTARNEQPDLILIAGDIFHQAKVWAERALTEVRVAARYIILLSKIAPVVILYGTPNHDGYRQYETLKDLTPGVTYLTDPGILTILTKSGPIQVAGLPGFDKGHFRAEFTGLSAEEENKFLTSALASIVSGLSAQVDSRIPSVLMAHHTVVGCDLDNGQSTFFLQNEMVLPLSALTDSAFDMVCLGHIHRAQAVGELVLKPIFYSGSIDAFSFNDEEHVKGFWIHELPHHPSGHKFIETPAREFITSKWSEDSLKGYIERGDIDFKNNLLKNKVVRILYTCDSETEKALDKKKLERDLYASGAYYVSEIRPESIHEAVNREKLHEKLTVRDCLTRYLKEKGYTFEQAVKILDEAMPVIERVEASQSAGGQTGLFLPVEISVRNYRSYSEETLSFQDIYFAMVNGVNGSGKSSLFMDALVDCLFEQPREGELTGWIRAGEKSGSITFTFILGNDTYRVTRTRQRSGKATLALARLENLQNDGVSYNLDFPLNWTDISCERMVDTQQKIIQLLGMDADTFKSCVLIMQDQYGKFMEAKPEDRMSVLASLLGLGIYEQLENETKELLQGVNRELRIAKEQELDLEQEVSQINSMQDELSKKNEEIGHTVNNLNTLREQKDFVTVKITSMSQTKQEIERLLVEATEKSILAKDKNSKLIDLRTKKDTTTAFLKDEAVINQKCSELNNARNRILTMEGTAKLINEKRQQANRLSNELHGLEREKERIETEINGIESGLRNYDTLHNQVMQYEGVEEELVHQEQKKVKADELSRTLTSLNNKLLNLESVMQMHESQAGMLSNSNCIDIERAQCGFLKAAKEAANKISELTLEKQSIVQEIEAVQQEKNELMYEPSTHESVKADAHKFRELKQQLLRLDGDKKLLNIHSSRLAELTRQITDTSAQLNAITTDLEALTVEVNGYDELRIMVVDLEPYENKWKQIPAAKQYLETITPQIEELEREVEKLNVEAKKALDKATELNHQVQNQSYDSELQAINSQIADLESRLSNLHRETGALGEKIESIKIKQSELSETKAKIEQLACKASHLQVLSIAFSQDGIPHQIMRAIIPELEEAANDILGQMTGGRMRVEFRTERTLKSNKGKEISTLDIVIIDVDHGELPYLARSGGQKVRAALAVSFALAILKASRVGLQLGMMFVDEPPFLDAEGVEAYCMALESIHSRYPEMRIVAISHDQNMKSQFPQQLYVEVTESGSKLRRG